MSSLGAPERKAFGTREWKRRDDEAWGPRTVSGRPVGPGPQTLSAYTVLLDDGSLYVSKISLQVPSLPKA